MEKIQTMEEYIAAEMGGKLKRKRQSPVGPLMLLLAGVGLLVLMRQVTLGDSLQAATLTVGILALAVGIVLTAMNLSGAMWHYVYVATGSRMKERKVYLGLADYRRVVDALTMGDRAAMGNLQKVTSSNSALHLLYSRDGAIVLVQAGRYDTGHFDPETPVVTFVGAEAASIAMLCR